MRSRVVVLAVAALVAGCGSAPVREPAAPPTSTGTAPPRVHTAGSAPGTTAGTSTTTSSAAPTTTTVATTTAAPTTVATARPPVPSTRPSTRPTPAPTPPPRPPTDPPATEPPAPPAPPPAPLPAGSNTVFVEGDSVLLGVERTLPDALAGWSVTMDTVGSRRLAQAIPVLEARRAEIGRVAVIMLGNNYIPNEGGSFGEQIDRAMQVLAGTDRVVWVTLAEKLAGRAELNAEIRAAAARWPTIVIADWTPIVTANPGYATSDGLHLSGAGRTAMTQLLVDTIGPPPP